MSDGLGLRVLGRTGLEVTPLCVGSSPLGNTPLPYARDVGGGRSGDRAAGAPARSTSSTPATTTATPSAASGSSCASRAGSPTGFVLETKVDRDMDTGDFSGDRVRRSVEESLERLGSTGSGSSTSTIPRTSSFEEGVAPGGPLEALQALKERGRDRPPRRRRRSDRPDAAVHPHRRVRRRAHPQPLLADRPVGRAAVRGGGGARRRRAQRGAVRRRRARGRARRRATSATARPARRSSRGSRRCTRPARATTSRSPPLPSSSPPATRGSSRRSSASRSPSVDRLVELARPRSRRSCGRTEPRHERAAMSIQFPDGFAWGTATASYQIEGAVDEDGRGAVDLGHVLAHARQGRTTATRATSPTTTTTATREDVAADGRPRRRLVPLLDRLAAGATRRARRAQRGGRRLLLAAGRRAAREGHPALGHALPLGPPAGAQDAGGWPERDTAERFAEYAVAVYERLRDRVTPGRRSTSRGARRSSATPAGATRRASSDAEASMRAAHHLMLGHGLAIDGDARQGRAGLACSASRST